MSKQFPILLQASDCLIFTFLDSLVEKGWFGKKKNVRNSSQYVFFHQVTRPHSNYKLLIIVIVLEKFSKPAKPSVRAGV